MSPRQRPVSSKGLNKSVELPIAVMGRRINAPTMTWEFKGPEYQVEIKVQEFERTSPEIDSRAASGFLQR